MPAVFPASPQCHLRTLFFFEKICSRRKRREWFDIRLACRQQRGDDFAFARGYDVAMGAADFAQQAMRPQPSQPAG